jgi:rhodanese-related sulfurtransferase
VSSTIAYEREHNALLRVTDEDTFVAQTTAGLGPQPPNFQAIVTLNRGPLEHHRASPEPLTPRQVLRLQDDGAQLVDVRTDLQFDDAHIPGAICNPAVRAGFGTKLAWVTDRERDVVLIGRDDEDARHAAALAASIGVTRIAGYLAGGMTSWREEKRATAGVRRLDVAGLHDVAAGVQVLDVRERTEWDEGHIPGSVHTPYHDITAIPAELDADAPIAAICSSGQRSAVAASLLLRAGARHVIHVADGGVGTWGEHGWPLQPS